MNGNQVIEISLDKILPNRFQPRIKFHEKNINELAESIREHGVIQPIVVRKISDKYEIIAGERRYKASVLANKKSIPALIVNLNDKDAAEVALIENVQRQDLTPIEEAVSYKKILDMGMTQEQLAQKLGKTQSTVANKLRLLNLDEEVQEALLEQKISERHARSLLKLSDLKDQVEILNKIISERLTVRKTDQVIKDYLANKTNETVKNNIEVLDLEEKGEKNMNYDNNNMNFNIPNTPIEGDNQQNNNIPNQNVMMPEAPVLEPIPDFGSPVQENVTNPGFMDVNKIENQAQDIFTETPKADVDNLLNEDQKMVEINNQFAAQNNEAVESANSGKFFNFMPNTNQENFVSDLEKQETNMNFMPQEETPQPQYNFDAFFNNNYVETNQSVQAETPMVNNTSMEMPVENSLNNNVNENPINVEPISNNIPTENTFNSIPSFEPNSNQINNGINNIMDNNSFDVNNSANISNENSGFTFEEPVLEPVQPTNNVNMNNNAVNNEVSMPDFNSMPQFDMNLNNNFGINNNPVETETVNNVNPEPVMPTVEETPTTPQDLGFNMDFRNINPTEEVTNTPVTPIIPEFNVEQPMPNMNYNQNVSAMPQEPVNPIMPNNNNMVNMEQPVNPTVQVPTLDYNEAINTLKNCCNELQNKGFNISIEQFDLENMAQLVVKIQK